MSSQSSSSSQGSGVCSTCHRSIALTASGVVHCHGPRSSRCSGSGQPAVQVAANPPFSISLTPLPQLQTRTTTQVQPPRTTTGPTRASGKILKRIPRASRDRCGKKLAVILDAIVTDNKYENWYRLLRFADRCLRQPHRGGRRWHLASAVNELIDAETDQMTAGPNSKVRTRKRKESDPLESMANRVAAKLEEGDFRGAVRLACSENTLAPKSEATYRALMEKHPSLHPDSSIPGCPPAQSGCFDISEEELVRAIYSFPAGSAGGPDGLRPQHLKDLISPGADGSRQVLLPALVSFIGLVLNGNTPASIRPFFFGANLTALEKKNGGVRPIAVGGHSTSTNCKSGWNESDGGDGSLTCAGSVGVWCPEGLRGCSACCYRVPERLWFELCLEVGFQECI